MFTLHRAIGLAAIGTLLAMDAVAQSAVEIRGASPYVAVKDEPPPRLVVDAPLPEGLAQGVYWAQYRVENLRIVPVFGAGARQTSPRVGHLHVIVDDLPWWWADASDNNTVDIANLPSGLHKVTIRLVDADHTVFAGQEVTHTFTIPDRGLATGHSSELRTQTREAEVNSAIDAFRTSLNSGDSASFFALLAPDLEVLAPGAQPIRGRQARESFRPLFTQVIPDIGPFTDQEITVSGDVAIQRHSYRLSTTPRSGGATTTVNGSGLHIWKRSADGRWQIVKDIWTVPPTSAATR